MSSQRPVCAGKRIGPSVFFPSFGPQERYLNHMYFKFMVAETALQVPLTCDIPQVASQIERHPAIRCQCAQKRNKGVVSSARPELQLVIGRDKTLCSKFQETSKDQTMLVNDGNLHRTLSHINTCSICLTFQQKSTRLQNCTAQLFCSLQGLSLYPFPYASSSKHWQCMVCGPRPEVRRCNTSRF